MMNVSYVKLVLCLLALAVLSPTAVAQDEAASFTGFWDTTYGLLELQQTGTSVVGSYSYGGGSTVQGTVEGNRLTFTYMEPTATGEGWFELSPTGDRISGQWSESGSSDWFEWNGTRVEAPPTVVANTGLEGLFDSTYGRLRLSQSGNEVRGSYTFGGGSTIEGTVEGNRLTFTYQEPSASGEGYFELSSDDRTLTGGWRTSPQGEWTGWTGERITPDPGTVWLVVLEAHWEHSLAEHEYAFGDMLRAYFERMPHVRVRHRRFYDQDDFVRTASELAYLAEPVFLLIASHGSGGSLAVNGDAIGPEVIRDVLVNAPNVFGVHFSACEIMVGETPSLIQAGLPEGRHVALSGYATAVDWSASALIEFLYLDLILGRGMLPESAANVVMEELDFAGDDNAASPLGSAQFR
ncbi:MAG: hypothetical protein KC561_16845, partial [Myxococcales bacterium]|nr:hypothetical protein [Myxococcales bacterium]